MAMVNDPWAKLVLSLEGGGTRGYASLSMLDRLMRAIEQLEKSVEAPDGFDRDGWEPHNSSFGPIPDVPSKSRERLPVPPARQASWFLGRRNGNGMTAEDRRTRTYRELDQFVDRYLPSHYFDYIGGTSTGGLAALMLGRLRMSADECIRRYPTMAKRIFGKKRFPLSSILTLDGLLVDMYDATNLEKEIKDIIEERLPEERVTSDDDNARFRSFESPEDLCKTVLFSTTDGQTPYIFRSYSNDNGTGQGGLNAHNPGPASKCLIWEGGRATSAAPRYLKPMKIGNDKYVDGAFGYNDPTDQLFDEVLVKEGGEEGANQARISLVLTLGTGLKPTVKERARGLIVRRRIRPLLRLVENVIVNPGRAERYMQGQRNVVYHKWNGGEKLGALSLDNCKEGIFEAMEAWVDEYMAKEAIARQLELVARELVRRRRARFRDDRERWDRFAFCTRIACPLRQCERTFPTRRETLAHVLADHVNTFTDPVSAVDNQPVIAPWKRGPW
ncbi:FabD/lysophospholipase-like protein [Xylariomycetidae sp. FL2044]|nr:FabD/lysophospholipase-like protein [Xylariomycetidae sp. FL2044]